MKTLIIYNDLGDNMYYVIVDGDYSQFHGIAIDLLIDHKYKREFFDFFFDSKTGKSKYELSKDISILENKEWDKVAVVTFHP